MSETYATLEDGAEDRDGATTEPVAGVELPPVCFSWIDRSGVWRHSFSATSCNDFLAAAERSSRAAPVGGRHGVRLEVWVYARPVSWWEPVGPDAWDIDPDRREEALVSIGELVWRDALTLRSRASAGRRRE